MKILCIIPIYNEEARLKYLLEEIVIFKGKTNLNIEFLLINNLDEISFANNCFPKPGGPDIIIP